MVDTRGFSTEILQGEDQVHYSRSGSGPEWGKLDLARDFFTGQLPVERGGAGAERVVAVAASGATTTLDTTAGFHFVVTLAVASTAIVFSGIPNDGLMHTYTVDFVQDGSGGRVVTFDAGIFKWPSGVVPNLSTGVNRRDKVVFQTHDGGATIDGNLVGINYS